jgi:hypothetical protein
MLGAVQGRWLLQSDGSEHCSWSQETRRRCAGLVTQSNSLGAPHERHLQQGGHRLRQEFKIAFGSLPDS